MLYVQDGREVDEVVLTMEGGPYQEYFHIHIPVGQVATSERERSWGRRFVYVPDVHGGPVGAAQEAEWGEAERVEPVRFPMMFGLEVRFLCPLPLPLHNLTPCSLQYLQLLLLLLFYFWYFCYCAAAGAVLLLVLLLLLCCCYYYYCCATTVAALVNTFIFSSPLS